MSSPARVPEDIASVCEALAGSPDAVFVTDRRNRIVFWNTSAERILGYTAEEANGAPCSEFLKGNDIFGNRYCSEVCPVTQMAARGETVRHFDLRLKGKGDATVTVDLSILHLVAAPPEHFYLAHVLRSLDRPEPVPRPAEREADPPRSMLEAARDSADARARKLTSREVEVLAMLAAGHMTPEIAARLHISTLTARNHIQNILEKLEVHSKAEAVAFAFQKRLL